MGKECTSCRHGVHFLMKLLLIQQMLKKRVTIREEKSKKYEKEKTLESNICGFVSCSAGNFRAFCSICGSTGKNSRCADKSS